MNRKLTEERKKEEHTQEVNRDEKKKTHKVRANYWVDGVLEIVEQVFYSLEEAVEYAEGLDCTSAKVYDSNDLVVKECSGKHKDKDHHTYA